MNKVEPQMNRDKHILVRAFSIMAAGILLSLNSGLAASEKPFPEHWGDPPAIQTRDYVEWPGGYGHGSSTVAHWIKSNMGKDEAADKPAAAVLYSADFESLGTGELPEDFMVLNGEFSVRTGGGARFMELPGTPLDSYAVMFGPAGSEDMALAAKIQGTSKGRLYPAFALGLNGLGGYRLKLVPARRSLELFTGPEEGGRTVAKSSFAWRSGGWVHLRLQIRKAKEDKWRVEGRAWMDGNPEPTNWMVSHVETQKPLPGRPFVAASPYAGTPIRFDELVVSKARE
jgi:hypothetical protein